MQLVKQAAMQTAITKPQKTKKTKKELDLRTPHSGSSSLTQLSLSLSPCHLLLALCITNHEPT
jgi:hypothetical protein